MKNKIKQIIKNKHFLIGIILPWVLVAIFLQGAWEVKQYLEQRDNEIFQTAWENGYMEGQIDQEELIEQDKISKSEEKKTKLLNDLAHLESMNGQKPKVLDSNNKYSLGKFHFQARTVKDLYRRYYKQNITIQEAVEIAQNDELSTKLAYDAIFVHKEYNHWFISLCKLGVITKNCLTQKQINNLFAKK